MLGKLIYVVIVAAVLLAGGFAFDYLAGEPGRITLDYGNRLYEVTLFEAAILLVLGIVVLMLAVWILKIVYATVRFILGDEYAFGGIFVRSRERRGIDAMGKGLHALAAGDVKTARKKAELAERKLQNPALTRLMNAQAADLAGERQRAATYYKALMTDPDTAFVGARGLLNHALADEDTDRALKLAERAREIRPKDRETLDVLYTLQSQKFDWAAARKTLTTQVKAGHVPRLEAQTRESALVLAQAEDADRLGEHEHARALAIESAKLDPANSDAVVKATQALIETGSKRAASKMVLEGWRTKPTPRLAAAFAEIEPDESPAQRRRRFETLFALQPDDPETKFLRAELSLMAEDWRGARRAIEDLRETEPSARSCAVMAAIARGEGEPDHIVRGWLARALGAPRGDISELHLTQAAMLPLLIDPKEDEPTPPQWPAAEPDRETPDETDGTGDDAEIIEESGTTATAADEADTVTDAPAASDETANDAPAGTAPAEETPKEPEADGTAKDRRTEPVG